MYKATDKNMEIRNWLILKSHFYRRAREKRETGKDNHSLNDIGEVVLEGVELTFS